MRIFLVLFSFLFLFYSPLSAKNRFLSLHEAFIIQAEIIDEEVVVQFDLAEDIYVYKERVALKITPNKDVELGKFTLPEGVEHDGEKAYLNGQIVKAPLSVISDKKGNLEFELSVDYQGCSEKGLCYEPSTSKFLLVLDSKGNISSVKDTAKQESTNNEEVTSESIDDPIIKLLKEGNILYIVAGFFVFGLLLSLTPCVFPMLPILSSVIVSHGSDMTTKKAFLLSMIYVQAMAVTYTVAGIIMGFMGSGVQAALQTPWIIGVFSAIFILLALSMFGLFEIQMPQSVQSYLNKKSDGAGKGYLSVAIMGLLSALIVGPCMAAPLAAALGFIAQTGDAVLAGIALYALSMGMGIPLLIVGTGAGKFMPRPGSWMDAVKSAFGVIMLAVAVYMLGRILDTSIIMFLWSALLMFTAVLVGAFEVKKEHSCSPCYAASKSLGLIAFLVAVVLFIGSITGASNIFNPLEKLIPSGVVVSTSSEAKASSEKNEFIKIHSIVELDKILEESKGKKIMLDFYADWCVSCKELEHITLADKRIQEALKDYVLVQADVTKNTDEEKALSNKFGLFGPPALIFFDEEGKELKNNRVIGFESPEEVLLKL